MPENEVCKGCGAEAKASQVVRDGAVVTEAGTHPWVAVMRDDPTSEDTTTFYHAPVCDLCHKDPGHRSQDPLKAHFFPRAQRKLAVIGAREQVMLDA
jgi:hypothetical protein